jgi:hypothetical protein
MNTTLIRRAGISLAAIMALGAVALENPTSTFAADTNAKAMHAGMHQGIEAHIKLLHRQLRITAAEEPQWTAVAQVMRDNAKAMSDAYKDRIMHINAMTAVDDINSFQAMTAAHADGLKNLAAAFAPLYAAMSPEQQKHADAVFGHKIEAHKHG